MKLKVTPEDFRVEEVADVALSQRPGPYAVYRLAKRSWDTFDLVDLLARRMGVPKDAISVGGMKDRHGRSTQLISVRAGASRQPRLLADRNFSAELAGYSPIALSARAVRGNRFSLVLRDMSEQDVRTAERNLGEVRSVGLPNYYDEQRFGSARHGGGFMGKSLFLGRREEALKLYFLPSKHDDRKTRLLKKCVTSSWGRWNECLPLGFGEYGRVLSYLCGHPRAYHKALTFIDRRFLVFVINAYQSFLFNEILGRYLKRLSSDRGFMLRSIPYAFGTYLFPETLPEDLTVQLGRTVLPVPGYDSMIADPAIRGIVKETLEAEEVRLEDLRVRQMKSVSAHGVERAAFVFPDDLSAPLVSDDELYPRKKKMSISFFLPRGSYATILVKRIGITTGSR
jgi:tRNA pseudouridine13 synthase